MEKEIFDALTEYDVEKVENIIELQLIEYPNDIILLLRLAVTVLNVPLVDYPKSLNCLKHIFELNKNNVEATILECCINYYHLAGIDEKLVRKINNLDIFDTDINSIKMLILSWHFANKDRIQQVQMLRQAIALSPNNVFPYVQLGRISLEQGNITEGRSLIRIALENIKLVYGVNTYHDFSDFNEYLNEKVRGIHLSIENKKIIEQMLL